MKLPSERLGGELAGLDAPAWKRPEGVDQAAVKQDATTVRDNADCAEADAGHRRGIHGLAV
ncbi:hypothetical protein MASR1M6_38060 [Rubrivivax sp.]